MREKQRRIKYEFEIDQARISLIRKHKKCKGTGFLSENFLNKSGLASQKKMHLCSCRKKFNMVSKFLISNIPYESLINQQIYGKKVIDVLAKEKIELRKEIIIPYVKNLKKAMTHPYGFLFLGKNGTGKTFIGLKVLYYAVINGYTAHNIEMVEYLKLARKNFDRDKKDELLLNEISTVDILLLDEVGNESKRSDFVISEFKALYKKRVALRKPTIIITNYDYVHFKKMYGKSITNMVQSHCKIFSFAEAVDVRKTKCTEEKNAFFKNLRKGS